MRTRWVMGIAIAVIGTLLLALGFFAVYTNINRVTVQVTPAVITEPVLVAAHDLTRGALLQEGDLTAAQMPIEFVPRGALSDPAGILGKIIKEDMAEGEVLLTANLADPTNVQEDLGFILSEDHVLMAFPANDRLSQTGIIQRGDLIDIYASIAVVVQPDDPETEEDEEIDEVITFDAMQAQPVTALVVDVDQEGTVSKRTYLLALSPQDALVVKNLLDQGAVFDIVLRNPLSDLIFRLDPVTIQYIQELYGLELVKP